MEKKIYRILAINGGGVKGIIPARVLQAFSDSDALQDKKNITDLFDYVVGTSIGGIIAGGLTIPSDPENKSSGPKYDPEFMVNLMETKAQRIFPDSWSYSQYFAYASSILVPMVTSYGLSSPVWITALLGIGSSVGYHYIPERLLYSKYNREGIDGLLEEYFGETRLNDTVIPVTMTSYSLDEDMPSTWSSYKACDNYTNNYYLKDAAGATSAAPTYLPAKVTSHQNHTRLDIDGGIFANSPTLVGILEFLKYHKDKGTDIRLDQLVVVSVGTGFTAPHKIAKISLDGALPWVLSETGLVSKMMTASERADLIKSSGIFKYYIRFNFKIDDELKDLDKSTPDHMQKLKHRAEEYLSEPDTIKLLEETLVCLNNSEFLSENCSNAAHISHNNGIAEEGIFRNDDPISDVSKLESIDIYGNSINS